MNAVTMNCKTCLDKSCAVSVLSDSELDLLANNISEVNFNKGEIMFKEKALNSHIIYMKKGLAKIHINITNQKDHILKIATPPSYLGMATIFGDCINQYSATAIEPTTSCLIDINTFKSLIYNNGQFAYEIITEICKDELCYFHHFVNQSHKQIPGKLAGVLLLFATKVYNNKTFTFPLTRSEIAELMGTSRENVTRNLSKFKSDSIIDIQKGEITILNAKSLERIFEMG